MYKLKQDSAKAAEELGFRMVFCGDINDFGGTLEEMEQDYFNYDEETSAFVLSVRISCRIYDKPQFDGRDRAACRKI